MRYRLLIAASVVVMGTLMAFFPWASAQPPGRADRGGPPADEGRGRAPLARLVPSFAEGKAQRASTAKTVSLEVLIVNALATDVADLKTESIAELNQQLQDLQDAGTANVLNFHLRTLENFPASAQFGEEIPVITSRQRIARRGRGRGPGDDPNATPDEPEIVNVITGTHYDNVGALIGCTAIVEPSGAIFAEVDLQLTRFNAAAKANDGSQDIAAADKEIMMHQASVRIAPGQTRLLSRKESLVAGQPRVTIVLLSGSHE